MKRQREDEALERDADHKRARPAQSQAKAERWQQERGGGEKVEVRTIKTEREEDPHRLAQRQKQIDYGKNTLGYDRYCAMVPRNKRKKGEHPMTPDKTLKVSKKRFDGMVRRWRQALHDYDPPELKERLHAVDQQQSSGNAGDEQSVTDSHPASSAAVDPELDELDPSRSSGAGPSIFDSFEDDEEGKAVGNLDDDDDDDLL